MLISVGYDSPRRRRSRNAAVVIDHFGVKAGNGRRVIASEIELPITEGGVVCFTGPSGSGKSSLLRAVADELKQDAGPAPTHNAGAPSAAAGRSHCGVVDMADLSLGDSLVIDVPGLAAAEAMRLLSACGLGEARLMLRVPAELSDGERYRLRLALAIARQPRWVIADEFTATLDRTLAKVVAYNVRRLADRLGIGFVIATTHEDILEDLAPSLHVRCHLDGQLDVCNGATTRRTEFHSAHTRPRHARHVTRTDAAELRPAARDNEPQRAVCTPLLARDDQSARPLSLARSMFITRGRRSDWPYFARWHYRGSRLPATQFITLLFKSRVDSGESRAGETCPALDSRPSTLDSTPIAICVFTAPPLALRERHRFFGQSGRWSRLRFQMLNRQLVTLARVVLHPSYRGAGIASAFVRRSCELCPWPWIEAQAAMGHVNPLFERAGFKRVGVSDRKSPTRRGHSQIYGTKANRHADKPLITPETFDGSRRARPVYYVFDNRRNARSGAFARDAPGEERAAGRRG